MEARAKNSLDAQTYIYWKTQINAAETWRDRFDRRGDNIVERYRNDSHDRTESRYNILYSNTETLAPVVYNSPPQADVRSLNTKRVASRKAAEMIEDAINYYVGNTCFDEKARMAVLDFLLPGLGVLRPRYKSLIAEADRTDEEILEEVIFEEIDFDYVHWKDFIFPECAEWEQLPWMAFKSYVTYDEAVELFGSDNASRLTYVPQKTGTKYKSKQQTQAASDKACVYEIWDKHWREQIFFAEGVINSPLEINDDPLDLDDFWPVPEPLTSISTSGTVLPVPFFLQYEDQAIELDDINGRIYAMIDNMKLRGVYDSKYPELADFKAAGDNTYYPIKNWTDIAGQGGLQGVIFSEDITPYANILGILEQSRQQILQDIFQIIGISDIRRAQTDPRETLGAQKIKSRYGTIRISTYQNKVATYMRNLLRISGEIIVKQFDAQTLAVVTHRPLKTKMKDIVDENGQPTGQQEVEVVGVEDLLKDLREKEPVDIAIDVQTDSTIIEDMEEQRSALSEAMGSLNDFTQISGGLMSVLGMEATSKLLMEIIQRFKLGRTIQQDVQTHVDRIIAEGLPETPSPEETLAQAELQKVQMQTQVELEKLKLNAALESAKLKLKEQENMLKARELGIEAEFKQEKINLEALNTMIKAQAVQAEAKEPGNEFVGV